MHILDLFPSTQMVLLERYEHVALELEKWKDDPDIYISFTDIPKLGVNPQPSEYNTPSGIFAYPLKQTFRQIVDNTIPFAHERPYVQVLRIRGNYIDVAKYDAGTFDQDIRELQRLYGKLVPPYDQEVWLLKDEIADTTFGCTYDDLTLEQQKIVEPASMKKATELAFEQHVENWSNEAYNTTPISKFWNITRQLGILVAYGRRPPDEWAGRGNATYVRKFQNRAESAAWNGVLRSLGYEAFTDTTGRGIIHQNEPFQAVMLTPAAYQHITTIQNVRKLPKGELRQTVFSAKDLLRMMNGLHSLEYNREIGERDLRTVMGKRLAHYANTEWETLLTTGTSTHLNADTSNPFWGADGSLLRPFVQSMLKQDYSNLPKILEVIKAGSAATLLAIKDSMMYDFLEAAVPVGNSPKALRIYAATMLDPGSLSFFAKRLPRKHFQNEDDSAIEVIERVAHRLLVAIYNDDKDWNISDEEVELRWRQELAPYKKAIGWYTTEDDLFQTLKDSDLGEWVSS